MVNTVGMILNAVNANYAPASNFLIIPKYLSLDKFNKKYPLRLLYKIGGIRKYHEIITDDRASFME